MGSPKPKLAIFINTLKRGGAEKVVAFLLNQLHDKFEFHFFVFNSRAIEFDIPTNVIINQLGKPKSSEATLLDLLRMPFQARKIRKYLEKNEIPVLLSFLNRPNFISTLVKILGWKGKVIISERTMTSAYYSAKTWGGRFGRFLVRKLYRRADLVITNSKYCEQDLRQVFNLPNKIITINNPIDISRASELMQVPQSLIQYKPGEFWFCNIGRFNPIKNQALLIEAFSLLTYPASRLLIIGKDVPEKLHKYVEKFGVQHRVVLLGMQENIYPFLKKSDCFVLSSETEGFPNVILEALAVGKPVIATDCKAGPREILAPGTNYEQPINNNEIAEYGILVPVYDKTALMNAMAEMIRNKALRENYATNSQLRLTEFSMQKITDQFIEVLNAQYPGIAHGLGD